MKKVLFTIAIIILSHFNSFSQNSDNQKIIEIQTKIEKLEEKKKNYDGQKAQLQSIDSQILTLEQEKSNLINSIKAKKQAVDQQNEDLYNSQIRKEYDTKTVRTQSNNALQELKSQQINLSQNFSNELNNLSNSMQNVMLAEVRKNLLDRQNLISGFYSRNQVKLNKIFNIYNQIPEANFNKNLNGLYKCYYITQKRYIYANNNEIISVEDCIVNIENNIIKNIYLYGNKEMELDLPTNYPIESEIYKGNVTYLDVEKLETYRIILLEPYTTSKSISIKPLENKIGYITLWSNNKKEEGKIVYVQELSSDKKQLIREISVKINYAKNEKELQSNIDKFPKIAVNIGNVINYLGEITSTHFGNIALHTKTSNSDLKPLNENEYRLVEIKKYRE
jgi:hypothetical protein